MLGDTFTGKTSLVLRFAEGYYRESGRNATVGAFFITKRLSVQGMTCKIQIWDTAGQEQFRKLAPMYYKNAAAAIICYDITSPKSFETLKYWIDELHQNFPAGGIVIAMCATKCDLSTNPDISEAEELAETVGSMFFTTSAKDNTNVSSLFEKVAERVLQFQRQDIGNTIPVTLATTSVETPSKSMISSDANKSSLPTITDSPKAPAPRSPTDGKRQRKDSDEEDDTVVLNPADSKGSSSAGVNTRCDANMLMCGGGEVVTGEDAPGCIIL